MSRGRSPSVIFEELVARVLRGAGVTSPAVREAAAGTGADGLPAAAAPVIEKIRRHAYKVTDEDIAALRAAGLDDDTIYELTCAASVGVARRRLAAAMAAIEEADGAAGAPAAAREEVA